MHRRKILGLAAALIIRVPFCFADDFSLSLTGALNNTEALFSVPVTLVATGTINLQTYGFGGGTNAAGSVIPAGGFDPFIGLFEGTGDGAVFLNGTSDELTSYAPGCPPAGTATIGSVAGQCGDVFLSFPVLGPGTYTVILSDAGYLPNAVFETSPGYLGDGFTDLTGGVFQTCYDVNNCNADTANWALDISGAGGTITEVPEPSAARACVAGMLAMEALRRAYSKRTRRKISE
jgi:hypothetical protein